MKAFEKAERTEGQTFNVWVWLGLTGGRNLGSYG